MYTQDKIQDLFFHIRHQHFILIGTVDTLIKSSKRLLFVIKRAELVQINEK